MAAKTFKTIEDYINSQPEKTKRSLHELKGRILKAASNAVQLFNYNIPAFILAKGGKREQQIMIAGYKKQVGFCPRPMVIKKLNTELKDYKKRKRFCSIPNRQDITKNIIF